MRPRSPFVLALLSLAACGDDRATTPPRASLTAEEAQSLARAMTTTGVVSPTTRASSLLPLALQLASSRTMTVACPGGGSAGASFTLLQMADGLSASARTTFTDCAATDDTGRPWVVSSRPALDGTFALQFDTTRVRVTSSMRGTLDVRGPDVVSSCTLDLRTDLVATPNAASPTGTVSVTGTICGVPILQTRTLTP